MRVTKDFFKEEEHIKGLKTELLKFSLIEEWSEHNLKISVEREIDGDIYGDNYQTFFGTFEAPGLKINIVVEETHEHEMAGVSAVSVAIEYTSKEIMDIMTRYLNGEITHTKVGKKLSDITDFLSTVTITFGGIYHYLPRMNYLKNDLEAKDYIKAIKNAFINY